MWGFPESLGILRCLFSNPTIDEIFEIQIFFTQGNMANTFNLDPFVGASLFLHVAFKITCHNLALWVLKIFLTL